MDLWGSDAQVGDEVYHIHFGKVMIEQLYPNEPYGLPVKLRLPDGRTSWVSASVLSWNPFPEFDRGKKKVKIKKWEWVFGFSDRYQYVHLDHLSEFEADRFMLEKNFGWKETIDHTMREVEE